ncbi:MAG TPA: heavy-metal-associated domain-containing protein [Casimicrobiaceae bacterium]|nr:heavy-metal-associated domain-containing protein [Casimicrobiaceae bacterium]
METVKLSISGMSCQGCVGSVTRVLRALPGVDQVDVQLTPGSATVSFDPARTNAVALREAVEAAGYGVAA